jgi:membrane associated rhomboid family serine protease
LELFITFVDDAGGHKKFPWANTILILLNLVICLKTASRSDFGGILRNYGFIPARPLTVGILTAPFLHASWGHLVANMTFLFMFGRAVEGRIGSKAYLASYLLLALAAEATHWYYNPGSTLALVGASRVVSGLGAMYLLMFPWGKMKWVFSFFGVPIFEIPSRTLFVFALWAAFLLALAYFPFDTIKTAASWLKVPLLSNNPSAGIAWKAHAGALAMGVVLFFLGPKKTAK